MTEFPESQLPAVLPLPCPSRTLQQPAYPRKLHRFRKNRLWLLLFLWLAGAIPELALHAALSTGIRQLFHSGFLVGPLFALPPAMAVFLLCTAIPWPRVNRTISLVYTAGLFFLFARQLGQPDGQIPIPVLLVMSVPLLIMLCFGRMLFSFRALKHLKCHLAMGVCCILAQLLIILALPLFGGTGTNSPHFLYHKGGDVDLMTHRLGLIATYIRRGKGASESASPAPTVTGEVSSPSVPEVTAEHFLTDTYNVLDLDFSELVRQEQHDQIASIHAYFAARTPSPQNAKTGIFSGYHLIQISLESMESPAPEESPFLSRLMAEGIRFSSYYASDWHSSGRNLHLLLTGIYPCEDEDFRDYASDRFLPLSMAQQLMHQGYSAFAYGDRKDRSFLENLGYEFHKTDSMAATEIIDRSFSDYVNSDLFHVYYAMGETEKADHAVELLFTRLESSDVLEHTVILLTFGHECVLWASDLIPESVDAPTSPADILPTMSNLFGLEFDSRLYMGRDVFSGTDALVLLPDGAWITDLTDTDTIRQEVFSRRSVSRLIWEQNYWSVLFP